MKKIVLIALGVAMMSMMPGWQTNFVKAKEEANKEHKYLLLSFSGSDWCLPCIRTRKEIFDNKSFEAFANTDLVLVNADFPRLKKNKLSKEQSKENDELADKYDKKGVFPLTILFDAEGKIVKEWTGFPGEDVNKFIEQIKSLEHR